MTRIAGQPSGGDPLGVAILWAIALLGWAPGLTEAQQWTLAEDLQSQADEVFSFVERDAPGCALGVIQDGKLAYGRGYGLANLDWGIPITTSTAFDIGSVSKQYTAAAIALLDIDGVLSLDDDVRRWVPELPEYGRTITVRHLLNHTSGIRDYLTLLDLQGFEYDNVFDEFDGIDLITRQNGLNFEPGSEYLYSNSGYLLLANVIRRATGQSIRRFLEQRFFEPLGMAHTTIWDDNRETLAERATGYDAAGDGWAVDHAWNFQMGGDGQVITSIDDMVKWDRLFYEPSVGGQGLLDRMHTRGVLNSGDTITYALGLTVSEYRGLPIVSHGGSWAGFRAHLLRVPGQHTSVAVMCNRGDADAGGYAAAVLDAVLSDALRSTPSTERSSDPSREPEDEVTLTEAQLARWVGVYRTPDQPNYWRFEVREGHLHILLPDRSFALTPLSDTRFIVDAVGLRVSFQPETDQWPEGVRVGRTVFLRQSPPDPTPAELQGLVGRYHSTELDTTYEIVQEAGSLVLHLPGQRRQPFVPGIENEYEAGGIAYVVERDGSGRVAGFRVFAGRVTDILFSKVPS
jgi:CubicO group peptidase (beta-lactamase class C family)